jgi:hypothetical protein
MPDIRVKAWWVTCATKPEFNDFKNLIDSGFPSKESATEAAERSIQEALENGEVFTLMTRTDAEVIWWESPVRVIRVDESTHSLEALQAADERVREAQRREAFIQSFFKLQNAGMLKL